MRGSAIAALAITLTAVSPGTAQPTTPDATALAERRQLVAFAKVGADLKVGQVWAVWKESLLCTKRGEAVWSPDDIEKIAKSAAYAEIFRQEMGLAKVEVAGQNPTDLFGQKNENANLQVGALITSLKLEACFPMVGFSPPRLDAKGSAELGIEWQIYSVSEGRIISKIPTTSRSSLDKSSLGGETKLIRDAFAANVRALAASDEFQKIVRGTAPSSVIAPQSELHLSLAPAARPVPLKSAPKSVVSIFAGSAMGSGVLISQDGYLLTNHHVAGDAGQVRVRWADGTESIGVVVRADRRRDVALIKAQPPSVAALPIRRGQVEVGETVYAIGTPLEKEFAGTLTRGVVSAVRMIEGQSIIQSDVAVDHGNSGGPLIDEQGRVIALTVSRFEPDDVGHNINFFIPIEDALRALAIAPAN